MLHQLELMGIKASSVKSNLTQDEWRNEELSRKEGRLSSNGTVIVNTGIYTGRSPNDRFIVKNKETEKIIDWGDVNLPLSEESFEVLENGDYVECAVSGKNIPLKDLEYWNVELQEAYFSPKEVKIRFEKLKSKK